MSDPLVLTLLLDPASQQRFDTLRRAHFPAHRNHLDAHLTLFHALPGERRDVVEADLRDAAAHRPPFPLAVVGPRLLGRGVALDLASDELDDLRTHLARRWWPVLTRQDRQPHRPHVTVQNKVEPAQARALHARLSAAFVPHTAGGRGLVLWRYAGGPWEHLSTWPFGGGSGA